MDLENIEDDATLSAHDHLRFTQARASYLSGVARGVSDALSLLEEPGVLHEISQNLPVEQAAFPDKVARIAIRQMSGYKLKHAAIADEAASVAMRAYCDLLAESPPESRCALCHASIGHPLRITPDYGPAPTDDELKDGS